MQLDRNTLRASTTSHVMEDAEGIDIKVMAKQCDVASYTDAFVSPRPAHVMEVSASISHPPSRRIRFWTMDINC